VATSPHHWKNRRFLLRENQTCVKSALSCAYLPIAGSERSGGVAAQQRIRITARKRIVEERTKREKARLERQARIEAACIDLVVAETERADAVATAERKGRQQIETVQARTAQHIDAVNRCADQQVWSALAKLTAEKLTAAEIADACASDLVSVKTVKAWQTRAAQQQLAS
jgi:hypothetical protein